MLFAGPHGENGRKGSVAMVREAIEKRSPIRQSLFLNHEGGNMTKEEYCEMALQEFQHSEHGEAKLFAD